MCPRVLVTEFDRTLVALNELRLLGIGLGEQFAYAGEIEVREPGQHARIADVFHQDARAHALESLVAQRGKRHAEHRYIVALEQRRARPRRVVDEVTP